MTLSIADIKKLKSQLPPNYSVIIAKKIKFIVGERQVQNVINGTQTDKHGIINIAIKLVLKEKAKKSKINKKINQL